jgi:hypothetical protein
MHQQFLNTVSHYIRLAQNLEFPYFYRRTSSSSLSLEYSGNSRQNPKTIWNPVLTVDTNNGVKKGANDAGFTTRISLFHILQDFSIKIAGPATKPRSSSLSSLYIETSSDQYVYCHLILKYAIRLRSRKAVSFQTALSALKKAASLIFSDPKDVSTFMDIAEDVLINLGMDNDRHIDLFSRDVTGQYRSCALGMANTECDLKIRVYQATELTLPPFKSIPLIGMCL